MYKKAYISLFKEEKRNYERKVKTFLLMEKKMGRTTVFLMKYMENENRFNLKDC